MQGRPRLAVETNLTATQQVAEATAAAGIARFVFASTCSVYGAGGNAILHEDSPLAPTELYAETRVNAERALAGSDPPGLRPTVLRFGTVYGVLAAHPLRPGREPRSPRARCATTRVSILRR